MGDMADWTIDQGIRSEIDEPWFAEEQEAEERRLAKQKQAKPKPEPQRKPTAERTMNLASLADSNDQIIEQLAALADTDYSDDFEGDWDRAMHFLLPSLIEHRPNDLARILWDRAIRRAKASSTPNPIREFQYILEHLDLAISRRV